MQTLVVMALKVESHGLFEAAGYKPFFCGVGSVKATHNLTKMILEQKPKRVINFGTAGSQRLSVGTLVECIAFAQRHPHDFLTIPNEKLYVEPLTDLPKACCGSGDFIEKSSPVTDCDVFDMEAYPLAYVCQKMNVTFQSYKYVTDSSNEALLSDWKINLKASAESLLNQLRKLKIESH